MARKGGASGEELAKPEKKDSPLWKDYVEPLPAPILGVGILLALPVAITAMLLILLGQFIRRPLAFFRRKSNQLVMPPFLEGLQHQHVEVAPGVKLHIATFGRRPDRPLLLFLHGFPECWYSWRHQLAHYRADYEVVAVDMRGFNTSDKPKGLSAYTLERLTADVAALVRALGRSSCTLVGHDWGAAVAWTAAGRYPGLVDRLAVLGGPHWLLYQRNLTLRQMACSYYFMLFLLPLLPEIYLLNTNSAFLDDVWLGAGATSPRRAGAAGPADVAVYKAALQQPGAATASLNYYRAALLSLPGLLPVSPEVEAAFRRLLEMPVLLVWGAKDPYLCLDINRDVDKVSPRVQVHVLPDCSHWIQNDRPEELHRIMDDWMAANPL